MAERSSEEEGSKEGKKGNEEREGGETRKTHTEEARRLDSRNLICMKLAIKERSKIFSSSRRKKFTQPLATCCAYMARHAHFSERGDVLKACSLTDVGWCVGVCTSKRVCILPLFLVPLPFTLPVKICGASERALSVCLVTEIMASRS